MITVYALKQLQQIDYPNFFNRLIIKNMTNS